MSKPIRIIHLEDIRSDADIVRRELTRAGLSFDLKWVATKETYATALAEFEPDIVLSDHSLPGFTSAAAFQELMDSALNIPFILVTATMSDEFAVAMMRDGVADYILKDRLQRLPAAITNALEMWHAERESITSHELLVQNEKRFRALIENSHDMIGVTDENFKPTFASSSYTRITGRTLHERRTSGDLDFLHPDDRNKYYEILGKVKKQPRIYFPVLYRMLHTNGSYIWVEGTIINMLHDESIQGMLFNLRDVTARIRAEESLKRSQANLTAVLENSNVSIYSIDRQFRYLSFNSFLKNSLRQIYGLEVKIGDHVFDFLDKLDAAGNEDWKRRYTEAFGGSRVEFEKEFRYSEYHGFTSFSINPIIEGDYVTGLSCFAWDITPQKQAALKLSQSEARFRALIENNHDAIVLRDENGHVLYASPSVTRMLGFARNEVFEKTSDVEIHPDDRPVVEQLYENVLKNRDIPYSMSIRMKHRNGQYIWIDGVINNMLDNENVKGIVSNFRDITARKEAELQRETIALDLIERNKNLEQYAYIVSHNLRAPVANILGLSTLLELDGISETDRMESLSHLFTSTRRLDDVIKDLNMILQMRQNINEKKEDVGLEDLMSSIMSTTQWVAMKTKVSIDTDFKVKTIATVRSYLYSIFHNLITNGIKYKREGVRSLLKITSEMHDNHIRLSFIDNGLGIDLEAHGANIFGLYKRFHPEQAEGKGMGLFMTKTQVEALGGKISVKSQVNLGTEFIIDL